jgi:hypothetical protein
VTKIARFCVGLAVVFALSMALASPCRAQQYTYGTWEGLETVTITVTTVFGAPISETTESFDYAPLTIQFFTEYNNI